MTSASTIKTAAIVVVVGCLGLVVWFLRGDARAAETLDLAVTAPRTQLRVGEGLPLEFAFRNMGAKTAYVELVHGARINEAGGERVLPSGPIDEPGPPPADHFARVNGRMTYVVPVEGIEAGQRIVETVSDVLARYHPLTSGRYTVIPVSSVRTYNRDSILRQDDLAHKTWAQPASAVHQFELESNPITIEVQ